MKTEKRPIQISCFIKDVLEGSSCCAGNQAVKRRKKEEEKGGGERKVRKINEV